MTFGVATRIITNYCFVMFNWILEQITKKNPFEFIMIIKLIVAVFICASCYINCRVVADQFIFKSL